QASATMMTNAVPGTLLRTGTGAGIKYHLKVGTDWFPADNLAGTAEAASALTDTPVFVSLSVLATDGDGQSISYEGMGFDASHPRWVGHVLAATPSRRSDQLQNLYAISIGSSITALALHDGLFGSAGPVYTLTGGTDGGEPAEVNYGRALLDVVALEDVSIVAAPGSSAYTDTQAINGALIAHAEGRRAYRIAVLDTPPEQTPGQAATIKSMIDSKYAALYYPWVIISNPLQRPGRDDIPREIAVPPSGFVCGIYARNDSERGVYKAPANEVVRSALRFEIDVNFGQQEMLNPLGVNCLRFLTGRGYRLWGARLVSSDPEWKYVSDRRYFNYLEASIDNGMQWAVFEPNGDRLWANITQTVSDFLYNEWRNGALLGTSTDEAFFVRCDRSTMTQNDLDNGRMVCLIGVAIIKPAEFVIFRIGQKTADART
ncbi:MAG TPA: phage tail sheath subtilisin-like domain-containing protein, partial [Rhodocyclaceae bacterium]|nr:phage tail sheath subtilisin-like domain-containing protein [Rhodocyclaceae bacterium]